MTLMLMGYSLIGFFGLVFGSFAGATIWRLRARQLVDDVRHGEDVDTAELKKLKPLTKETLSSDRSRCLRCNHTLQWYDLLPLVSWLSTGGKCRYCKKPIGWFEPVMELLTAVVFIGWYFYWSTFLGAESLLLLAVGLVVCVLMIILFMYDAKWFILPDVIVFPLIAISALLFVARLIDSDVPVAFALSTAGSLLILSGLYFAIWLASKGTMIGFGDVKLGIVLGLLLADWKLAFLALFLANLIGLLVVLPGLTTGRLDRKAHIPFGPMLIIGFALAYFFGAGITSWFESLMFLPIATMLMLY